MILLPRSLPKNLLILRVSKKLCRHLWIKILIILWMWVLSGVGPIHHYDIHIYGTNVSIANEKQVLVVRLELFSEFLHSLIYVYIHSSRSTNCTRRFYVRLKSNKLVSSLNISYLLIYPIPFFHISRPRREKSQTDTDGYVDWTSCQEEDHRHAHAHATTGNVATNCRSG